jgi:hypothetical protein
MSFSRVCDKGKELSAFLFEPMKDFLVMKAAQRFYGACVILCTAFETA